jgi:hypothetical protein
LADVNTGDNGILRVNAWVSGSSAAGNWSDVSWELWVVERNPGTLGWVASGIFASMAKYGSGYDQVIWEGSFGYDFRPAGQQSVRIASGTERVNHRADGTSPGYTARGYIGGSGTSTLGGPTECHQGVALSTLKVLPNVPTGVTATRLSDTQVRINWSQSSASNGRPTNHIIQRRVDGGSWTTVATISAATSYTATVSANHKYEFRVQARNAAGTTSASSASSPVYTTPGAPSNVRAVKNASNNIVVSFNENVTYSEYQHEVQHGVLVGTTKTWDSGVAATLSSGTLSWTHVSPNSGDVHIYRVRARTSSGSALTSGWVESAAVQLLAPPNKPTVTPLPALADRAEQLVLEWTHNPVDTTPQRRYEINQSLDGGTTWTVVVAENGNLNSRTFAANTFGSNQNVRFRVRTWGDATSGGSDGAGASPWSDLVSTTFKTKPTVTVTSPAPGSTLNESSLKVNLNFAQVEGATLVKAVVQLLDSTDTVIDSTESTTASNIPLSTRLQNSTSYSVRARVQDSNGLWSAWATSAFSVSFLPPASAEATLTYLEENGFVQIDILINTPGAGEAAVETVTVLRTIDDVTEVVVQAFPYAEELSFIDTVPTIHGLNEYTIITTSAPGAETRVAVEIETEECRRAFLSKGTSYQLVGVFGGNLNVSVSSGVAQATFQAAGRTKPIGLYGVETSVQLKVESRVFEGFGSTLDELNRLLLVPGRACYRDSSGRRVFGAARGDISYNKVNRGDFSFTITETD